MGGHTLPDLRARGTLGPGMQLVALKLARKWPRHAALGYFGSYNPVARGSRGAPSLCRLYIWAAMADAGAPAGGATDGPPGDDLQDDGPARQNEIADTLRKLRKLVIFSGDELTENLPLYLNSESLLEEIEARVEDAKLYMQGQARTARATGGQRQWLARGVSPERELEKRAARATSWVEFTQAEAAMENIKNQEGSR